VKVKNTPTPFTAHSLKLTAERLVLHSGENIKQKLKKSSA